MSVLGALVKRSGLNDPAVPLTSDALADWINGGATASTAGIAVTEQRAYGLTAYWRGVVLLASAMAGMPIKLYENGSRVRVTQRTVLTDPCPEVMTPFEFWQAMYANAITWGIGYAWKRRDGGDVVRSLDLVHPSKVVELAVSKSAENPLGRVFRVTDEFGEQSYATAWDLFRLPYMSIHGTSGMRPLLLARQVLGINLAADENAARFYGQGSRLGGVLQTDTELTKDQAEAIQARWMERTSGPTNAGKVVVIDKGLKFDALSIPPGDAQLLESRQFGVSEVARLLGVPQHLLMDTTKTTTWGTGIEQQTIGLVVYTLQGWMNAGEQRITRELLPGGWTSGRWYAEYSAEGLLRGDSKARAEFYRILVNLGVMSPAEVRPLENLPEVEGLDFYMVPKNMEMLRPGDEDADADALSLLELTTALQRVYLAVGKVITADEARELINRGGGGLVGPLEPV